MSRALYVLYNDEIRDRVANLVKVAPKETRVLFKGPKRTLPQNDKMWAMLTDVAEQREHCGRKYTPDEWKTLFMSALGEEMRFAPSLDGKGFIPLGHHSSELSIAEMADLITFMDAWGAENGIVWKGNNLRGDNSHVPAPLARSEGFPARAERQGAAPQSTPSVRHTHGSKELDEDAAKLFAMGQDPGPTFADLQERPSKRRLTPEEAVAMLPAKELSVMIGTTAVRWLWDEAADEIRAARMVALSDKGPPGYPLGLQRRDGSVCYLQVHA